MTHRRGAIWTERMLLGLILLSLAATLNLLVAIHRRAADDRQAAISNPISVAAPAPVADPGPPEPGPAEAPALASKAEPTPAPAPAEDPTQKALGPLVAATAKEVAAAEEADRRIRGAGARLSVGRRRVGSMEAARDARSSADRRDRGPGRETRA